MATSEMEQTAQSRPLIFPIIEHSLKELDSKFDIGNFVESKQHLKCRRESFNFTKHMNTRF